MKVGSLVVCVDDSNQSYTIFKYVVKNRIYTIREICHRPNGTIGFLLEELVNPKNPSTGLEVGYKIERFRELDTPVSISIEDILHETVPA